MNQQITPELFEQAFVPTNYIGEALGLFPQSVVNLMAKCQKTMHQMGGRNYYSRQDADEVIAGVRQAKAKAAGVQA